MKRKIFLYVIFLVLFLQGNAQPEGLKVGETAPDFTAKAYDGTEVNLKKLLEKGPVVLVFYRGAWCPYCTAYMSHLQDSLHFILEKGGTVIAVTPEKSENITKMIQKTGASFFIIHDENHLIMDLYKTTFQPSGTIILYHSLKGENLAKWNGSEEAYLPVPATYIISSNGKIFARHFDKDNIKIRMPVKKILEYLDRIRLQR